MIGDPIAHSKSPLIHKFWLEKLGIEGDYRATRVTSNALASFFEERRRDADWRGCNVAMPHKREIWPLLGDARGLGSSGSEAAVNCVTRIAGGFRFQNFDVDALMRTVPAGDGPVALIGAGGAATAAVEALMSRTVIVLARNATKGRALARRAMEYGRYQSLEKAANALRTVDGVINASPLGMNSVAAMPEEVLAGLAAMRHDAFVYDMVYHPVRTKLLERAKDLGLATIDGLSMLIEQAALSFSQFFRTPPPREHDKELRELLRK